MVDPRIPAGGIRLKVVDTGLLGFSEAVRRGWPVGGIPARIPGILEKVQNNERQHSPRTNTSFYV